MNKTCRTMVGGMLMGIFLLVLIPKVPAQTRTLTLDAALALVDKQNPMLQEYDNKAKALQEYSAGASAWMAPMVGAGTFMTPYARQMQTEERDKGSMMFSIEQQIPNPTRLKANKNYLQSRAAVETASRSVKLNALRAEVKMLYYRWLVDKKKMKVLHENERIVDLMLKLAHIRYPLNQGSIGNIYKAEGRLAEVQNMLLMTLSDVEDKKARLKAITNLAASDSVEIDTTTIVTFDPMQISNDTASFQQERSDIRQINQTIEVMRLNQMLQQTRARPDFRIRFDHMQPIGNMPAMFSAMAMISIPIAPWSSKMYKSEVKGMEYDIEAMKKSREAILIESRGMIIGMSRQLIRMKQQLDNYENKIIPALRKNYQTVMIAYEENREQLPMVIDAWEAMNMSQQEYLDKLLEYYTMIVNYEKQVEK
jgi:cobalt-zinc-cadmium efflux system outer membrane protein